MYYLVYYLLAQNYNEESTMTINFSNENKIYNYI